MTEPIDRFLVIHEYTCPACGGSGYQYNPQWQEANRIHDAARDAMPRPGEDMTEEQSLAVQGAAADAGWNALSTFWREHGYYSSTRWPPEEYLCTDCNGKGVIRESVDLIDVLRGLKLVA